MTIGQKTKWLGTPVLGELPQVEVPDSLVRLFDNMSRTRIVQPAPAMTDEALQELLEYLFEHVVDAEQRVEALSQIVVDYKIASEREIEDRVKQIRWEKETALRAELIRRSQIKQLASRLTQ